MKMKNLLAAVVTAVTAVCGSVNAFAAEPASVVPQVDYTTEQTALLRQYLDEFIDHIDENGNTFVDISASTGLTSMDFTLYVSTHNLGQDMDGLAIRGAQRGDRIRSSATVPVELKAQRATVKEKVAKDIEGMEPTLENIKKIYEKYVMEYQYLNREASGACVLLQEGSGKCRDFAVLYSEVLSQMGIQNYCVKGTVESDGGPGSHLWNAFVYEGTWYAVDICEGILRKNAGQSIWNGFVETKDGTLDWRYKVIKLV